MPGKNLSDQEFKDVHDTIVVLLAIAGDCDVKLKPQLADVIRRGHEAIRTERDPPFMLLPSHGKQKRLVIPEGVRAMHQDQYLKAPPALGKSNGSA